MGLLKWLGLVEDACHKEPLALDDTNFADEMRKAQAEKVPVLIDVWSPGCAPCAMLAPTIMKLACKYEGKVKVCHVNAAAAPKTMSRLGVRGTPTVLFYDRGNLVERVVGVRGQHYYEEMIRHTIGEDPEMDQPAGNA